ncbi:MAG: helix-turn-helix transcriptional regulator, partial [Deltaproteobacteria bacterium]|nr:helix-turn-helix transcriptional regulator [Deltaproteobacteria bacterium]
LGYNATSLPEIVRRAKVSRGAQVHHFPVKLDLIEAAAENLYTDDVVQAHCHLDELRETGRPLEQFLERLWIENFNGRVWAVTLELIVASRTDEELRARLMPIVERYHRRIDDIGFLFFRETGLTGAGVDILVHFSLCVLRGMGVQTVLKDDPSYYKRMLEFIKVMFTQYIEMQDKA